MSIKPIKSKMLKVLDRERKKTQEELDKYYHKMKDTESYWGFNGPYARQEKAYEKREQHLEEIERFEHQLEYIFSAAEVVGQSVLQHHHL